MSHTRDKVNKTIDQIKGVEHGFKHICAAGDSILADASADHFALATTYLKDDSYQVRMLATYLLGQLSTVNVKALKVLETKVAADDNWRVQEMLAKAFDHYCHSKGYKESLPLIKKWLSAKDPNLRRAVVEGLRIWTGRPFFKENPEIAIQLISQLRVKADETEYLVKSVGNALRDIRKKYKDLVDREIAGWDVTDKTVSAIKKLIEAKK
ncbi:DNA alkylation repair protein [Terrimonas sp. NA20]|uniref:DNA alkylation repair protein n=1 Tax=Terrimonas ginsenosidimutans TaxID=2908004 RepID=A0ABS9KVF1_9BACT|nr:DNA alkylation repair protein [Terrimonas ginsenosidimutans]MCG2616327.1 DNA alkylation repair protein [Terrimonas ginsenosidimutans]